MISISFLQAGQILALVGATGSGKSSIINLILRFYNVDSGTILLDGKDIMQYNIQSLRSHIASGHYRMCFCFQIPFIKISF